MAVGLGLVPGTEKSHALAQNRTPESLFSSVRVDSPTPSQLPPLSWL